MRNFKRLTTFSSTHPKLCLMKALPALMSGNNSWHMQQEPFSAYTRYLFCSDPALCRCRCYGSTSGLCQDSDSPLSAALSSLIAVSCHLCLPKPEWGKAQVSFLTLPSDTCGNSFNGLRGMEEWKHQLLISNTASHLKYYIFPFIPLPGAPLTPLCYTVV